MTLDYSKLPEVWQWILLVAAIIAAITVIWVFVRKAWPAFVGLVKASFKFVTVVNSLADLPQFMITTAQSLHDQDETLERHSETLEMITHEIHENSGKTLKDAIVRIEGKADSQSKTLTTNTLRLGRIEKGVKGLYDRADKSDATVATMQLAADVDRANIAAAQNELETTRPPRKRAS